MSAGLRSEGNGPAGLRPKVLIVCSREVRELSLLAEDLERLEAVAEWEWLRVEGGEAFGANEDAGAIGQLIAKVGDVDAVVVSHGSPRISAEVMDAAPQA